MERLERLLNAWWDHKMSAEQFLDADQFQAQFHRQQAREKLREVLKELLEQRGSHSG